MRLLVFRALILPLAMGFLPNFVLAQEPSQVQPKPDPSKQAAGIAPKHHAWGRFEPGAWQLVRVVTETFDENGKVTGTSTTETKTTLVKIEDDGITLQLEVRREVAGKQFDAEPQVVKRGFYGELIGEPLKIKEMGKGEATIEEKKIPCKILRLENSSPTSKTVTSLYYSTEVAPYILQRESTTTDLDGKETLSKTTSNVTALKAQCEGFQGIFKGMRLIRVEGVHKYPNGTATTTAITSPDMPGGTIRYESKELNKVGRLTRRDTLEMVGYGLKKKQEERSAEGEPTSSATPAGTPRPPE